MKIQIHEISDLGHRLVAIDVSIEAINAAWGTIRSSMSPVERAALETLKIMKLELLLAERNAAKEQDDGVPI